MKIEKVLIVDLNFNVKKNNSLFSRLNIPNKFHKLFEVIRLVKNWQDPILFKLGLKKKIIIKMRDGRNFEIKNLVAFEEFWKNRYFEKLLDESKRINLRIDKNRNLIIFKFNKKQIYINFGSESHLEDSLQLIYEEFVKEIYEFLEPRKKIVINIGASIGDSAIYFALKGAKHVYAFEPYPYSYNIAKWNIKINKLEDKITLVNAGCGKRSIIQIPINTENYISSAAKTFAIKRTSKAKDIQILSLEEIIDMFKINEGVLEMDCEGCEYSAILESSNTTLRKFSRIIIEYHHGYINLVKKLKTAGFEVKYTLPANFGYDPKKIAPVSYVGMIYAKRKSQK